MIIHIFGELVHLDFYNRSFGGLNIENKDLTDKIIIELENKKIEFKEHRIDNGHNNWFAEQYLESTEFIDGSKIRISMCEIKGITSDLVNVILILEYRDYSGQLKPDKTNRIEYTFPKKILTEILVKN
nr:hypothetical protein [uncultured Flavobacterium sp.]